MSDVEPLIRRELQWMALGTLEDKDLASIIIAKSRRRRLRRLAAFFGFALVVSAISIQGYILITNIRNAESISTPLLLLTHMRTPQLSLRLIPLRRLKIPPPLVHKSEELFRIIQ